MQERQISRVMRDENGTYHWVYSLPMLKNFTLLRTILKIVAVMYLAFTAIIAGIVWFSGVPDDNFKMGLGVIAIVGIVVMLIAVGSYFLSAAIFHGYYVCIYEMDQEMFIQRQPKDQAERSEAVSLAAAVAGVFTNNFLLAGAALTQGDETVVKKRFSDWRSLKIIPSRGEIKVHSFLTWFTIWVNKEDFPFVADYLSSRCVNARIVRKP